MKIQTGIQQLKLVTSIKKEIKLVYAKYHALTKAVQIFSNKKLSHFDLKRAVDAIHYEGGGWPHPESKGRMEALCDALAGMYKILFFIGRGSMVEDYLRTKHGITITILKAGQIKDNPIAPDTALHISKTYGLTSPPTLSALTKEVVLKCDGYQGIICKKADMVRDDLRPSIKKELEIDDPEYDRILDIVKIHEGAKKSLGRMDGKVKKFDNSFENFKVTAKTLKKGN